MLSYVTFAAILGLSAGFAPGPLLTLVIGETLQHGRGAGVKVAVAPLITDTPIIIAILLLFSQIRHIEPLLGGVAIAGGIFVFTMGISSLRIKAVTISGEVVKERSLLKGVIANLLNPAPYLFWVGVGAPMLIKASDESPVYAALFLITFYSLIVGSKILLAAITEKSRGFLRGDFYINIMRLLGIAMCVIAIFLIYDGLKLMQVLS